MALSAALVFETRAAGSDNNGGGFHAGAAGTDRSQANSAFVVIDNSVITTSITANVITFTGYTPTAADVGNVVQMLTGTNVTAGFYEITAQTATTWTVTGAAALPTAGTTTNATGSMGGALATLNKLSTAMIGSNKAYSTGAFTTTATITFTPGAVTPSGSTPPTRIIGYGAARGDATHATLTLSTNTTLTGIVGASSGMGVEQIDVDCASLATSVGISMTGANSSVRNCLAKNFASKGIRMTAIGTQVVDCELTGGTAAATAAVNIENESGLVMRCFVHDNACAGIAYTNTKGQALFNLVVNNSGASSDGITTSRELTTILNNTIHNNGRDGIRMSGASDLAPNQRRNNLLTSNGGYGMNDSAVAIPATPDFDGNVYWNNTSGARNNLDLTTGIFGVTPYTNVRDVTLTGSPYTGPTTGSTANFGLNATAGAGAACRGAGSPRTWPGNTGTTGFLDMGAVQHQDAGAAGMLWVPDLSGGMSG